KTSRRSRPAPPPPPPPPGPAESRCQSRTTRWCRARAKCRPKRSTVRRDPAPEQFEGDRMRRREFIAAVAATTVAPLAARAQQPAVPVVGFLSTRSPEDAPVPTNAFRRGLEEMGFVEGRSVAVEYRWARGDYGTLPGLAADLLGRPLSLIVSAGDPAAQAAKAAGLAIPLVFIVGL